MTDNIEKLVHLLKELDLVSTANALKKELQSTSLLNKPKVIRIIKMS